MTVVSNTSPLIFLAKIERLDLLLALYEGVVLPRAVLEEVEAKSTPETSRIRRWGTQSSIQVERASDEALGKLPPNIGAGERAAIALALDFDSDLVLLDDQEGRQIARAHALTVTGTIGVLIEAREADRVASLASEPDRLVEAGL